jgi:hypothetical protein
MRYEIAVGLSFLKYVVLNTGEAAATTNFTQGLDGPFPGYLPHLIKN